METVSMGILNNLFGVKPHVSKVSFPDVIPKLVSKLEFEREQFLFGSLHALQKKDAPPIGISNQLEGGSNLDSALKGFQLTCVMGFAWDYIDFDDQLLFDRQLTEAIKNNDRDLTSRYRKRYLDCKGNVRRRASFLAEDIHVIWEEPAPEDHFRGVLSSKGLKFGIICQATVANVFGDSKTEKLLKSELLI
jgi:hypothetical protein